jgi:hypothetical protein
MLLLMKTTASGTVKVSINTLDNGDETIVFRTNETTGQVFVKEHGKKSREISLDEAFAWMMKLQAARWGLTTESKEMPVWALVA